MGTIKFGPVNLDTAPPFGWERRHVVNQLAAYLLRPKHKGERDRVLAKFNLDLCLGMEKVLKELTPGELRLLEHVRHWVKAHENKLLSGGGIRAYRIQFYLGEAALKKTRKRRPIRKKNTESKYQKRTPMRGILTCGAVVETMYRVQRAGKGNEYVGLERATSYLQHAKPYGCLYADDNTIPEAWRDHLAAAHLAGAFYVMTLRQQRLSFGKEIWSIWEENLPTFLDHARTFYDFLTKEKIRQGDLPLWPEGDLWKLPLPLDEPLSIDAHPFSPDEWEHIASGHKASHD